MRKKNHDSLESYDLFYEEIPKQNPDSSSRSDLDKAPGLSEEQLSRLSEDLRQPIRRQKSNSNPLQ
jgi:hypothetical protein